MKNLTDAEERQRFSDAHAKMPNTGEMRYRLFPVQLPKDFYELLKTLDFVFDVPTRTYSSPDLPDVSFTCLWSCNMYTYNKMTLTKVLQPGETIIHEDQYGLEHSTKLFTELMGRVGYSVDGLLRLRKLKALAS